MKLPVPAPDKAFHMIYGNAISFVGALLGLGLTMLAVKTGAHLPYWAVVLSTPWALGLVSVALLAVWKEWFDGATGTGVRDKYDAIATVLGGLPVVIVAAVV